MNSRVKRIARELVRDFGEFDGLNIHKKFTYSKRLTKILLKKNYTEDDDQRILDFLLKDEKLISLNKEEQRDKVFSKIYRKIPRNEYRQYKDEIYQYMYEYLDLFVTLDLEKFIKISKRIVRKK